VKRGAPLSLHIEYFIDCLRSEMRAVGPDKAGAAKARFQAPQEIARPQKIT